MKLSPQVVFRHIEPSGAVSANIDEHVAKLEKLYDRIMACQVVIEEGQRRHQQGNLFCVRVSLKVPDEELVASRTPDKHHSHEDVYVAIRDAFESIRRQLEEYVQRRRGQVKTHQAV